VCPQRNDAAARSSTGPPPTPTPPPPPTPTTTTTTPRPPQKHDSEAQSFGPRTRRARCRHSPPPPQRNHRRHRLLLPSFSTLPVIRCTRGTRSLTRPARFLRSRNRYSPRAKHPSSSSSSSSRLFPPAHGTPLNRPPTRRVTCTRADNDVLMTGCHANRSARCRRRVQTKWKCTSCYRYAITVPIEHELTSPNIW